MTAVKDEWVARRAAVREALKAAPVASKLIRQIKQAIDDGDLTTAATRFQAASRLLDPLTLVMGLAETVPIPDDTIIWGTTPVVFANPLRQGWAWRCPSCPTAGVNYRKPHNAKTGATRHRDEDHPTYQLARLGV